MRTILILFALISFVACDSKRQNNKPISTAPIWSEEQKRKFFADSLADSEEALPYGSDSLSSFERFMKRHYPSLKAANSNDPFIYALDEPYIDTTSIDTSKHWLRITVKPCFRLPYCLILEQVKERVFLTIKAANGSGCSNTGTLAFMSRLYMSDSLYNNVARQLQELNFWTLQNDTTCQGGLDGETWTIEAIEGGKYNIVQRWRPQGCGNNTTRKLASIGLHLRQLSRFDKAMEVYSN